MVAHAWLRGPDEPANDACSVSHAISTMKRNLPELADYLGRVGGVLVVAGLVASYGAKHLAEHVIHADSYDVGEEYFEWYDPESGEQLTA